MAVQQIEKNGVYTVSEAAQLLKIGDNAMYRLLKAGKVKGAKTNDAGKGYWRILGENLLDFLRNN